MKTNQSFNMLRFLQYARAHFSECKRFYFWHFAVSSMIYFMVLMMVMTEKKYETEMQMVFYYIGLISTGGIFAMRYFSSLGRTGSALVTLMQPVSTVEKWLLAFISIVFFYPFVYTIIYEVMTAPVAFFSREYVTSVLAQDQYLRSVEYYQLFVPLTDSHIRESGSIDIHALEQVPVFCFYIGVCGFALTASVFFKRFPLLKSVALSFCLFLLLLFVAEVTGANDYPKDKIFLYWFSMGNGHDNINAIGAIASTLLWIISPLLIWVASYFALKERDLA